MKAFAFFLLFIPALSFADIPRTTSSQGVLAAAAAKGYSVKLQDMNIVYHPKFVSEASVALEFQFTDLLRDGKPIPVVADRNDSQQIPKLLQQFDAVCADILDIKEAKIPGAKIKNTTYEYWNFKMFKITCTLEIPAK